jgi:hypothetical protein
LPAVRLARVTVSSNLADSFDHFVGAGEQHGRNIQGE